VGSGCSDGDDGSVWLDRLPESGRAPAVKLKDPGWTDLLTQHVRPLEGTPAPIVARVTLSPPPESESTAQAIERKRQGRTKILLDQKTAWSSDIGSAFRVDVELDRDLVFRTALGVSHKERARLPGGSVHFDVQVVIDGVTELLISGDIELDSSAADRWHPVEAALPPGSGTAHLVFRTEWRSPSSDTLPAGARDLVRACHANPLLTVGSEKPRSPNVLFFSVDTLRADHLGCYGYDRSTSPRLDALAQRGVLFENCFSSSPWTLPSYGSLFTSLHPTQHRAGISKSAAAWRNEAPIESDPEAKRRETLLLDVPTLAELLAGNGYRTAALFANPFLHPRSGLDRGFSEYTWFQYSARSAVDLAMTWLDRNNDVPTFLFVQVTDPHWPYAPPEPFDALFSQTAARDERVPNLKDLRRSEPAQETRRQLVDLYDGEIAFADAEFGRLIDHLAKNGTLDDTLVVFHSDHGEEFWDHGGFEHGHAIHSELLRVPLILHWPKALGKPLRVPNHVRTLDVLPTILDLVGIERPATIGGSSLVPYLGEESSPFHLQNYAESLLWGPPLFEHAEVKSLTVDGFKIVLPDGDGAPLLYDVINDPLEQTNLAEVRPAETRSLVRQLRRFHDRLLGVERESPVSEPSAAELEMLRQLGYVGGDATEEK